MEPATNSDVDIIMAIRERMMTYFKGTCIHQFTRGDDISLRTTAVIEATNLYADRRLHEVKNARVLMLRGKPMFTMQSAPFELIFHLNKRNKFRIELEDVVREYLPGVKISFGKVPPLHDNTRPVFYQDLMDFATTQTVQPRRTSRGTVGWRVDMVSQLQANSEWIANASDELPF